MTTLTELYGTVSSAFEGHDEFKPGNVISTLGSGVKGGISGLLKKGTNFLFEK